MAKGFPYLLVAALILFTSCSQPKNKTELKTPDNILALVGDKAITVNDFIKRCEYVPRPPYCRGDNYIHKKIALNSLIAEKLFAIEFENRDLHMTENQRMVVEGQKEQTMRHLMLQRYGFQKVTLDTNQIQRLAMLSNREYRISFINVNKKEGIVFAGLPEGSRLKDIVKKSKNKIEVLEESITINDNMIDAVNQILYYGKPNLNQLYGPFESGSNNLFYFEVSGWTTRAKVTEKEKKDNWDQAQKQYSEKAAKNYYSEFVSGLLKGKTIEYNPEVFPLFSKKLSSIYLIEKEKKEAVIENRIWEKNEETEFATFDDIRKIESFVVLKHDKKEFKISDLLTMIKKHPLVFRNKTINPNRFDNELKYAIADLFRDYHITKKAYRLGLDKDILATHNEKKWQDYIKSLTLNKSLGEKAFLNRSPGKHLIQLADSLQIKHSGSIKIDTDKFDEIELSNIDMSVMYINQPYAKLEPNFPIITNDHLLDYGQKFNFDE